MNWDEWRKRDIYYRRAKKHGYFSRAVYKIAEINNKYKIFRENITVLDIGTSPGSWSQYILRKYKNVKILGIDIAEPKLSDERYEFIKGDITDENIKSIIFKRKFDVILSDACPKLSGIRDVDDARIHELLINILEIIENCLKKGGNCVIKAMNFSGLNEIYDKYKRIFEFCKLFKPKASTKRSREIYIIGKVKTF